MFGTVIIDAYRKEELDDETGIGLIEKKRQGFGKANIIYVKNFVIEDIVEEKPLLGIK